MPPSTVLILADNADSAGVWEDVLRRRGIESTHLRYGVQPLKLSLPEPSSFALVLVDSQAQGDAALAICASVRATSDKPILLLTHEKDERFQLRAYEVGVDECIVTPVSVLLVLAKIRVWLQRRAGAEDVSEEINESGFRLAPTTRQLLMPNGRAVKLSSQEFQLLRLFLANPERVLPTDLLMSCIWSGDPHDSRTLLTNLIYRLRKKLDPRSSPGMHIRPIPGEGYKWETN